MSRGSLAVRFPDGTVRYGIYNGTVDVAWPPLFDAPNEAWDAWRQWYGLAGTWDGAVYEYEEGAGEPVDVATNYGGGWSWKATATRNHLTSKHDWDDFIDARVDGEPDWAGWGEIDD